jgi:hypothetical protein
VYEPDGSVEWLNFGHNSNHSSDERVLWKLLEGVTKPSKRGAPKASGKAKRKRPRSGVGRPPLTEEKKAEAKKKVVAAAVDRAIKQRQREEREKEKRQKREQQQQAQDLYRKVCTLDYCCRGQH